MNVTILKEKYVYNINQTVNYDIFINGVKYSDLLRIGKIFHEEDNQDDSYYKGKS